MYCNKCGKKIDLNIKYCENCGNSIDDFFVNDNIGKNPSSSTGDEWGVVESSVVYDAPKEYYQNSENITNYKQHNEHEVDYDNVKERHAKKCLVFGILTLCLGGELWMIFAFIFFGLSSGAVINRSKRMAGLVCTIIGIVLWTVASVIVGMFI